MAAQGQQQEDASPSKRRRPSAPQGPAKGFSLHIGLNVIDVAHYGSDGRLSGCVNDARAMERIARDNGFDPHVLLDGAATLANVKILFSRAAGAMAPGDVFFVSYSGHGSSVFDQSGDEDDGRDETWCLYDGMLVDDELDAMLCAFPAGSRVVIVSDSCHSGTVSKALLTGDLGGWGGGFRGSVPRQLPASVTVACSVAHRDLYNERMKAARRVAAASAPGACVILLAGCQDNQLSMDGPANGAFTTALLQEYYKGGGAGPPNTTYEKFLKSVARKMPSTQSPKFLQTGADDPAFRRMRPFSLTTEAARPCTVSGSVSASSGGGASGSVTVTCHW